MCLLVFFTKALPVTVVQLLECCCHWCSAEGVPEPMLLLEPDQLTAGMINTTNAVIARLQDFHSLLQSPPLVSELHPQHHFPQLVMPLFKCLGLIHRLSI